MSKQQINFNFDLKLKQYDLKVYQEILKYSDLRIFEYKVNEIVDFDKVKNSIENLGYKLVEIFVDRFNLLNSFIVYRIEESSGRSVGFIYLDRMLITLYIDAGCDNFDYIVQIFDNTFNKQLFHDSYIPILMLSLDSYGSIKRVQNDIDTQKLTEYIDFNLFKEIGIDPKALADEFLKSKNSILILTGNPGTGKSKLISAILYYMYIDLLKKFNENDDYFEIYYIKGYDIISALIKSPELLHRDNTIYILDDFDVPDGIFSRENDDHVVREFINIILSATDGILPTTPKIIISTNMDVSKIDEALLRDGRLFDVLQLSSVKFKELSDNLKNKLLKIKNFNPDDSLTISQIVSYLKLLENENIKPSYLLKPDLSKKEKFELNKIKLGFHH